MTSTFIMYVAAALAVTLLFLLAYVALPSTPRRIERGVSAIQSPTTLIIYMLVILAAAVDFFETIGR